LTDESQWSSLADVRRDLNSADVVGEFTVFNIKGNAYRLVTVIDYRSKTIYIRAVLTHAQYAKEGWKR
jgi:mRNA interferase HigB